MKRQISLKLALPAILAVLACFGFGYYRFMRVELHPVGPVEGKRPPESVVAGLRAMAAARPKRPGSEKPIPAKPKLEKIHSKKVGGSMESQTSKDAKQ